MTGPGEPPLNVVALVGPTAVGKTELSLLLAERMNAEIVSADSMLVYRDMNIGTAKPTPGERARVPHHLIDVVPPSETFSVGRFRDAALAAVADIDARQRRVLIVGGTGLYLRALNRGLCDAPPADADLRASLAREARDHGSPYLHHRLREVDPKAAARIQPGDTRRIVRALEVHRLTGIPLSAIQESRTEGAPFRLSIIVLTRDREELYERIARRVDAMLAQGLVAEVRELLHRYRLARGPRQALGYKEIIDHLRGETDLAEAVERIKVRTRRFAKRQLTWFRGEPGVTWITMEPGEPTPASLASVESTLANLSDSKYP